MKKLKYLKTFESINDGWKFLEKTDNEFSPKGNVWYKTIDSLEWRIEHCPKEVSHMRVEYVSIQPDPKSLNKPIGWPMNNIQCYISNGSWAIPNIYKNLTPIEIFDKLTKESGIPFEFKSGYHPNIN